MNPPPCDHGQPLSEDCRECAALADATHRCLHGCEDCPECEALAEDGEYGPTEDCLACHGRRVSYIKRGEEFCEACHEDGGPHAGDDPFGRTDEDWKHHAE